VIGLALDSSTVVSPVSADAAPQVGVACTSGASPAPVFNLVASAGHIQMSDMNTMYMWTYSLAGGTFQYPGPLLCVNEGDTVTINLTNQLPNYLNQPVRTSIMFPGQSDVRADGSPAQPDLANNSLTNSVAPGGSIRYSFVAGRPGTFIYESGTDTRMQVSMGLAGAIIVRPTQGANFVYDRADSQFTPARTISTGQTLPSEEFLAFLTELDPYQHQAVEANRGFNMNNYKARYWMLNGRGFPDIIADNYATWLPNQPYGGLARIHPYNNNPGAGDNYHPYPALERFVNVGTEDYPFHPHGQNGLLIGRDGYPLADGSLDLSMEKFDLNIGPGQTWDVLFKWYDAEGYDAATHPVPGIAPDLVSLTLGMFYSGSPYLGSMQTLPPGKTTLNQCGEYYIISHNHALFQLDAFGQTMSGPITYLRIDPPLPNNCP
jgi:FtsP/CotA-like multicopper oxidase with cupredoxin domain